MTDGSIPIVRPLTCSTENGARGTPVTIELVTIELVTIELVTIAFAPRIPSRAPVLGLGETRCGIRGANAVLRRRIRAYS